MKFGIKNVMTLYVKQKTSNLTVSSNFYIYHKVKIRLGICIKKFYYLLILGFPLPAEVTLLFLLKEVSAAFCLLHYSPVFGTVA
jgi:hypothetical protein